MDLKSASGEVIYSVPKEKVQFLHVAADAKHVPYARLPGAITPAERFRKIKLMMMARSALYSAGERAQSRREKAAKEAAKAAKAAKNAEIRKNNAAIRKKKEAAAAKAKEKAAAESATAAKKASTDWQRADEAKRAVEEALDALDGQNGDSSGNGGKAAQEHLEKACASYAKAVTEQSLSGHGMPPPKTYSDAESLFQALKRPPHLNIAPVRLLRASWILERAERLKAAKGDQARRMLALPRRQQLEKEDPDAFITIKELRGMKREKNSGKVAIASTSYAWLTPEHPDPKGQQLITLADTIRSMQKKKEGQWHPRFPSEAGIFIDFASLCQKDEDGNRSDDEKAAFGAALASMQIWYAHRLTTTFMLRAMPKGWESLSAAGRGYKDRGWCTCESSWAGLIKDSHPGYWKAFVDVGEKVPRPAPITPEAMAVAIARKKFTSAKADLPMVIRLNAMVIVSAFGQLGELVYAAVGWGDKEFVALADIMPLCKKVGRLDLGHNQCGDAGAIALAKALKGRKSFGDLSLQHNKIGDAGALAIGKAVKEMGACGCLRLGGNPVSKEVKERIREMLKEVNGDVLKTVF